MVTVSYVGGIRKFFDVVKTRNVEFGNPIGDRNLLPARWPTSAVLFYHVWLIKITFDVVGAKKANVG